MKVILIEEDRVAELVKLLDGKAESLIQHSNTPEVVGFDRKAWDSAVREAHRQFHYEFVMWAQSHGASCVSR